MEKENIELLFFIYINYYKLAIAYRYLVYKYYNNVVPILGENYFTKYSIDTYKIKYFDK